MPFQKGHKLTVGENSGQWKGDNAGSGAIHIWVARKLGKPSKCEDCGTTKAKKYDWANISGKCKRDLSDWRRLCRVCHMKYDNSVLRGEKHNQSKLKDKEVLEIRRLYNKGNCSQKELVEMFNSSNANISLIVNNKAWKHLL